MRISQEFFERAKVSYNLSIKFILDDSLKSFEETSIREMFHTYELLMKAHISKEHSLLLYDTKTLFKNKKLIPIDSLFAKSANELVELLGYLKAGNTAFDFLFDERDLIEKIRSERNSLEHSSRSITNGFKGLILAPFVRKVLRPLFIEFDSSMSTEFTNEKMLLIFSEISDFSELVPVKNKFNLVTKYYCDTCDSRFSFLAKTKNEVFCLICETTTLKKDLIHSVECFDCKNAALYVDGDTEFSCPDCQAESDFQECDSCGIAVAIRNDNDEIVCLSCNYSYQLTDCPVCGEMGIDCKDEELFCHDCDYKFVATKNKIGDEGCSCQSTNFYDLKGDTGQNEAFCLDCRSVFRFQQCPLCQDYFSGDFVEGPEEYGSDCCEDCAPELFEAYSLKD